MLDEVAQNTVAAFGILGCPAPGFDPVSARGIGSVREIGGVPEFGGHEFRRMVVDADDAAAAGRKTLGGVVELGVGGGVFRADIQLGAETVAAHIEYIQQPAVPERLLIQADLIAFIEIHRDAEPAQREVGLRSPGTAGLAIANGWRREDAPHVGDSGGFAALELSHAFEVSEA